MGHSWTSIDVKMISPYWTGRSCSWWILFFGGSLGHLWLFSPPHPPCLWNMTSLSERAKRISERGSKIFPGQVWEDSPNISNPYVSKTFRWKPAGINFTEYLGNIVFHKNMKLFSQNVMSEFLEWMEQHYLKALSISCKIFVFVVLKKLRKHKKKTFSKIKANIFKCEMLLYDSRGFLYRFQTIIKTWCDVVCDVSPGVGCSIVEINISIIAPPSCGWVTHSWNVPPRLS